MPKMTGKPQMINEKAWFYDGKAGLLVVTEAKDRVTGAHIQTDQFVIPWGKILASGRRCGKIE